MQTQQHGARYCREESVAPPLEFHLPLTLPQMRALLVFVHRSNARAYKTWQPLLGHHRA